MSDKYRTSLKRGGGILSGIVPREEYVIDIETDEVVGELTRWDWQEPGDILREGRWEPYGKGMTGTAAQDGARLPQDRNPSSDAARPTPPEESPTNQVESGSRKLDVDSVEVAPKPRGGKVGAPVAIASNASNARTYESTSKDSTWLTPGSGFADSVTSAIPGLVWLLGTGLAIKALVTSSEAWQDDAARGLALLGFGAVAVLLAGVTRTPSLQKIAYLSWLGFYLAFPFLVSTTVEHLVFKSRQGMFIFEFIANGTWLLHNLLFAVLGNSAHHSIVDYILMVFGTLFLFLPFIGFCFVAFWLGTVCFDTGK